MPRVKLLRITTVPQSLKILLKGQLGYMKSKGFEVIGISSPGNEIKCIIEDQGVEVYKVSMSRQITPLKDLLALFKLILFFKKENPVIVHTHTPKAGILGMLAAKVTNVPIRLHTVAGMPLMEAKGYKKTVLESVEKLTYFCASKVYPNSKGLESFILENNYAKKEKVKLLANGSTNGIDTSYFNSEIYTQQQNLFLKKQLGIPEHSFVFIFVGRLVADKGIKELVQAFKAYSSKGIGDKIHLPDNLLSSPLRVSREMISLTDSGISPNRIELNSQLGIKKAVRTAPINRNVKLLLVGPYETHLDPLDRETIDEIENNPNIISVGFQEEVRPYFAVSDALVFPSYREGFPNVVMQAGAMNLPSIVSDIIGCNEIIIDGKNGIIIPPKDTKELENAMQRLVEDSLLFKRLKSQARELIITRYEQVVVWEALFDEYVKLLEKTKK